MYNLQQAEKLVHDYLHDNKDYELIIDLWMEKPYGWIFEYQTKEYIETGNVSAAVAGNAPILFEKETGKIIPLGIAPSPNYYIELYEKGEFEYY